MIKILFFIDELTGGGAEKVLRTLVNNMDQQKFQITVHTLNEANPNGLLAPGVRYKAINRCKTAFGKKLFSYWIRLCAELKWLYPLYIKDDYDIEAAYLECGPTKIIAGSTNKKAKKVAWVHCDLAKKEGTSIQTEKLYQYYSTYDKIVCVSKNVKESFVRQFGRNPEALVLYNVNDETEIREKATALDVPYMKHINMVSIGRLTRQKGFDRLIEACAMLKQSGYDFHLRILGEGSERSVLEEQIRLAQLQEQIELTGFLSNPYPYIQASDLVVCSSRYEGFSTVATESLILGKPIVTTPCTGMDELLGDSEYGLITEDSVEGIYLGMKKMLDDPQLRSRYAQAALLRGKAFSKEKLVQNTEQFFLDLLNH